MDSSEALASRVGKSLAGLVTPAVLLIGMFWLPLAPRPITGAQWQSGQPYGSGDLWWASVQASWLICALGFTWLVVGRGSRRVAAWWALGAGAGFVLQVVSLAVISDGFSS